MIQIRIVAKTLDEVIEWVQRIDRMANNYADVGNIIHSGVKKGQESNWMVDISVKQEASVPAPEPTSGLAAELRTIEIYTALGQLWGLAEAILGEIEPDVTGLLEDHVWSTIEPNRRDRIRWLYDSLPQDYVIEAIRQAKEEEELTGAPLIDIPGHYWPKFFYLFALVNSDTKTGQAVIKEFINPDPPPVIRLGDE